MTKRKSFVIHIDSLDILDDLNDEQAGQLFKAIKSHQLDEDLTLSPIVKIAFSPFKNQFVRDDEKYQITCKARAAAGSKGGKQKVANASKSKQKVANVAENDSKSVNDSKSDSDNNNKDTPKSVDFSGFDFMTKDELAEVKRIRSKNKGGAITQRVANALVKEFAAAGISGYSVDQILTEWEVRGWKSFKADWMPNNAKQSNSNIGNVDYSNSGGFKRGN